MIVKKLYRLVMPLTKQYSNSVPRKDLYISYSLKEVFSRQQERMEKLLDKTEKLQRKVLLFNVLLSIFAVEVWAFAAFVVYYDVNIFEQLKNARFLSNSDGTDTES